MTAGHIVVAPGPFKGALAAPDAARAIAAGLAGPVSLVPVADGGEGTLAALVAAHGAETRTVTVADPLGRPVDADFGLLPDGVCVVELAQASGYERLTDVERDPEATSTYGTGELIRAALDSAPRRIVVTVGGSATTDGGLGIARALGARILDAAGHELPGCGRNLGNVATVDLSGLDHRLHGITIDVACDVRNPLVGPDGAAHVFGPQKGAGPDVVLRLDAGLADLAEVLARETGVDVSAMAGAGAAGGAAGGMVAMLGARILDGATLVLDAVGLADALRGARLCITGEGRLDAQTAQGKAPAAVAAACRNAGVPCVGLFGEVTLEPDAIHELGFTAALPIRRRLGTLADALATTSADLRAAADAVASLLR